jgi:predicted nucleotidyltransferase
MSTGVAALTDRIQPVLAAFPDVELVVVFGPVSTGSTHAGSDLDLAILPLIARFLSKTATG